MQTHEYVLCSGQISPREDPFTGPVIRWSGRYPNKAQNCFEEVDLFILPTLSDGFVLTQLEAQAHGLPVIVSRFCAGFVERGPQRNDS
jgi:glycosyltransferase involved in cell wall biosynthesis